MVPPPWELWSPSGAVHHVSKENELIAIASSSSGIDSIPSYKLREVVGISPQLADKSIAQLPLHRSGWQLGRRVRWLQNVHTGELTPVLGGDAHIFMKNHGHRHADLQHADGSRLNEFLQKSWYWSTGAGGQKKRVDTYGMRGSDAKFRLLSSPPSDGECHLKLFLAPTASSLQAFSQVAGNQQVRSGAFGHSLRALRGRTFNEPASWVPACSRLPCLTHAHAPSMPDSCTCVLKFDLTLIGAGCWRRRWHHRSHGSRDGPQP